MTWRRLAEMFHLKHALELQDERSTRAKELAVLTQRQRLLARAVNLMDTQNRLGSYHRIRIGRDG